MADQSPIDLAQRAAYRHFTPVTIRFCDTDKLGHVNNVAIASFFEAARCEIYYRLMAEAGVGGNIDFVLARVAINFRREFFYPGTVEVGARFVRLGTRSIVTGYGLFLGPECHATAESVNVFFDLERRESVPPPVALKALIERQIAM